MQKRLARKLRQLDAWSVLLLCAAFALIFCVDQLLAIDLNELFVLDPAQFLAGLDALRADPGDLVGWGQVLHLFTPVLGHADAPHLAHNAAFFWLFGSLLVRVAGNRTLLVVFAVTAATASIAHVVREPDGAPIIGASGAISGVAGAYCLLAFRWDVPDAYAWPLSRPIPPIHAAGAALLAAGMDIFYLSGAAADAENVAYDAHIGGFAGGLVLAMVLTSVFSRRDLFLASWIGGRSKRD